MFYLFFPLVCVLLGRGKLLIAVLLAFVLIGLFGRTALTYGNPVWEEYSYLGGMDAIALGCLTALLVTQVELSRRTLWTFTVLGTALLIFRFFLAGGKPMETVPALFIAVILISSLFGEVIAHFYSEPMNRFLRNRWGDGPNTLGSVVEDNHERKCGGDRVPV